jgi:hypothetical protein
VAHSCFQPRRRFLARNSKLGPTKASAFAKFGPGSFVFNGSRVRQNVVLELGLLLSKFGRARVAILMKRQDNMEKPSDIDGLIYIPFVDDVEDGKVTLAKEMQQQRIKIDLARL